MTTERLSRSTGRVISGGGLPAGSGVRRAALDPHAPPDGWTLPALDRSALAGAARLSPLERLEALDPLQTTAELYRGTLCAELFHRSRALLGDATSPSLKVLFETAGRSPDKAAALDILEQGLPPPLSSLVAAARATGLPFDALAQSDALQVELAPAPGRRCLAEGDAVTVAVGGARTTQLLSAAEADELNVASATRRAVLLMIGDDHQSRYDYAQVRNTIVRIPAGRTPSEAMKRLLDEPRGTHFDCAVAITFLWHAATYLSYRDRFGDEADARFDRDFHDLAIGYSGWSSALAKVPAPPERAGFPGTHRYFDNPAATDAAKNHGGRQGENVMLFGYAGPEAAYQPLYFAHPGGLLLESELRADMERCAWPLQLSAATVNTLRDAGAALPPGDLCRDALALTDALAKAAASRRPFEREVGQRYVQQENNSYALWQREMDPQADPALVKRLEDQRAVLSTEISQRQETHNAEERAVREQARALRARLPTGEPYSRLASLLEGLEPPPIALEPAAFRIAPFS